MKIKWLGHACFLLTSESGLRIMTDPYTAGVFGLDYAPPSERADIVTVSHDHADHNNVADVKGNPQVVQGAGSQEAKGIQFKGVASAHDQASGKERGPNTIFCFSLDGINVCHLGDLGHDLAEQTVADIGGVDVLLIPVGGNFTIDAAVANRVCQKLAPKVTVSAGSEVELKKEQFPATTETVVLPPAL